MEAHGLEREAGQPRGGVLGLNLIHNDPELQIHQLPPFPTVTCIYFRTLMWADVEIFKLAFKFAVWSLSFKVVAAKANSKYKYLSSVSHPPPSRGGLSGNKQELAQILRGGRVISCSSSPD